MQNLKFETNESANHKPAFADRIQAGKVAVKEILVKIWLYIILGIGVGAVVHGYLPDNYLASVMKETSWYSMPLAVLTGIPLYSCSPGAVPIAYSLIEKGVPLGTALAFMMSVIGISLPELIILKKVLKLPLILTFVGILTFGIIIVGYLLNFLF